VEAKVGTRLKSAVCTTEVIVVRSPGGDIDLRCGGHAMLAQGQTAADGAAPDEAFAGGSAMGKRYSDDGVGLEVLVTKAGAGSLSIGDTLLPLKDAKALPSSD